MRFLFPHLVAFLFCAALSAQTQGTWSADAQATTSSLHGGAPGGRHEHVEVTNDLQPGGSDTCTVTIVHFVVGPDGKTVEETYTASLPYLQKVSFHGDVKSVVVTAGNTKASGSFKITYP
jgi:hypothetical protein